MNRRQLLKLIATTPLLSVAYNTSHAANAPVLTKKIPSTGEAIPVIGMGTWITFNVGNDTKPETNAPRY